MKQLAAVLVLGLIAASPVRADDGDPQRCGFMCKVWRNVSGKVQTPVETASWDDGAMRVPTADEEARRPRTDDLVVQHGDLLHKSRAERLHEQAVAAAQIKRIDALRPKGGETAAANVAAGQTKLHDRN